MVARIRIGKFPDGGYGVRVSEAGYSAISNPVDNERMIFNSDWGSALGVVAQGEFTVTSTGTLVVVDVAFPNLGFAPLVLLAMRTDTGTNGQYDLLKTTSWISYPDFYSATNHDDPSNVGGFRITSYPDKIRVRHHNLGNSAVMRTVRILYLVTNYKLVP